MPNSDGDKSNGDKSVDTYPRVEGIIRNLWTDPWHLYSHIRSLWLPPATQETPPLPIQLCVSELSKGDLVVFEGFSFNTSELDKRILPQPAEVRRQAQLNGTKYPGRRVPPVEFPSQGLIVKSGLDITVEEGRCLWAIGRKLQGRVSVPEIYGWCRDQSELFIYMELIQGVTLEKRWNSLATEERAQIWSIGRQKLQDIMFEYHKESGPFLTVKEFHDWFAALVHPDPTAFVDPFRSQLSDATSFRFTHGDLHPSNIIVSLESNGPPKVRAIIDWHQSGWYPDYWEHNKALYTAEPCGERATEYVPRFLEPSNSDAAWEFYMSGLGC